MLGLGCCAAITEDAVERFFGRVQFLFNFATEKFVVIRDWRLVQNRLLLRLDVLPSAVGSGVEVASNWNFDLRVVQYHQ